MNNPLRDKAWLTIKYIDECMSAKAIGELVGLTRWAVFYALKTLDISRRKHSSKFQKLNDKEWLRQKYIDERLSITQVADLVGTTRGNVRSHLKCAGIPVRSYKEGITARFPQGRLGERANNWRGGRRKLPRGYISVYAPDHPCCSQVGYVMEHRVVMEKSIGRLLTRDEVIHHKNGVKDDNRLENLELLRGRGEHSRQHFNDVKLVHELQNRIAELEAEIAALKATQST